MVNSVQKSRVAIGEKAIREVEEDRFPIRLPAFKIETTSPCPHGFDEYVKEDFRKNISGTNGRASGSILMMVDNVEVGKDSISVKLTMFVFKADATFLKSYSGASKVAVKNYGNPNIAIDPLYKKAYAAIRSAFKNDATSIAGMLSKN
jgi:hypothetical protein